MGEAHAQQSFGQCDQRAFLVQSDAGQPSTLYDVRTQTNPFVFSPIGNTTPIYNSIGFNPGDSFIYGITTAAPPLLMKVGADGVGISQGAITGLPAGVGFNAGEFGTNGIYYAKPGGAGATIYTINLTTLAATPLTLSSAITVADIAWVNGLLYAVSSAAPVGQLYSINPTSGAVTSIGVPGNASRLYGALFGTPSGLY